ncbi:hypothetical protein ACFYWP_38870 [Actinacidiphila glaucinigra]|uniref:hypothetical protein n=1 Tax=Actinacidiphila glaucinigra TaxID=235986 RepID=UPI0036CBB370
MHLFTLSDGTRVSPLICWDDQAPDGTVDGHATKLSRLQAGEQFAYVFDMGDDWAHLCTVTEKRIDPFDELGEVPDRPVPYWGAGAASPPKYARRWDRDDGQSPISKRPARGLADLPPILPWGASSSADDLHQGLLELACTIICLRRLRTSSWNDQ